MPGLRWLARLFYRLQHFFYSCFPGLQRKLQSKGHGVHSPFAFDLITKVIYSPHSFYAFSDITLFLSENGLESRLDTSFHHLSFRLVYHLTPKSILEINSGIGINTLFIREASPCAFCCCYEPNEKMANEALLLLRKMEEIPVPKIGSSFSTCRVENYDAIFVSVIDDQIPDIDMLLEISAPTAFWVIYPIKKRRGKHFWNRIVHDERIRITFDMKTIGIAFLDPDYHKVHYLI